MKAAMQCSHDWEMRKRTQMLVETPAGKVIPVVHLHWLCVKCGAEEIEERDAALDALARK